MKKLITTIIVASLISPIQARSFECLGIDKVNNRTWKIIGNENTDQFIMNGDVLKTDGSTANNSDPYIVWTENFINEYGMSVYNGIGFYKKGKYANKWFLIQKNAITHKLASNVIELSCSRTD